MGRGSGQFQFGLTTRGGPFATDELSATSTAVGCPVDWVLWFEQFGAGPPISGIAAVDRLDASPMITWEPWRWRARRTPLMAALHAGVHDAHIRRWAAQLRSTAVPVYLRFGHEFNGDWYPWSSAGGTAASVFVDVWHRLHNLFHEQGATGVRWVWAPAANPGTGASLEQWYPGDAFVDLLAVDGYNWGTSQNWSRWVEPAELFDPVLDELRRISSVQPLLITEVGCAEAGGSKAEWITEFGAYLLRRTDVTGFVWFDHDKETDWRLTSTPEAASAMTEVLRRLTHAGNDCRATT